SLTLRADGRRVDRAEAERLASIVEAASLTFDRIAAGAPAELRKGPRGGGRDRDKMVGHVIEADWSYARELGLELKRRRPVTPRPSRRCAPRWSRSCVSPPTARPSRVGNGRS